MAKMFDPSTGEIVDSPQGLETSIPKRTQGEKPVYAGKTFEASISVSDKEKPKKDTRLEVDPKEAEKIKKIMTQVQKEQTKPRKANKAEELVESLRPKYDRRDKLQQKYINRVPRTDSEKAEFDELANLNYELGGGIEAVKRTPLRSKQRGREVIDFEAEQRRAKEQQANIQARGEKLSIVDRALGNIAQGTDELLVGAYSTPAVIMERTIPNKELLGDFLGGYGKSVKDLQRETQERRQELQAFSKDAGWFEKGVGTVSEVAGQLAPVIAGGAFGVPAPALAAASGVLSSFGTGEEESALAEGVFGAAGAFAGMGAEKFVEPLVKKSGLNWLTKQIAGRTATGAAGAAAGELENYLRGIKGAEGDKNVLLNAAMDFLFYGGGHKGEKKSGLRPTYERAFDEITKKNLNKTPFSIGTIDAVKAMLEDSPENINISKEKRLENLNNFLTKSVAKKPNGEPLPLYHGTASPTEIIGLDPQKMRPALYGPGFYMTTHPIEANHYALVESGFIADLENIDTPQDASAAVYKFYANIEKPLDIESKIENLDDLRNIGKVYGEITGDVDGGKYISQLGDRGFNVSGGTVYDIMTSKLLGNKSKVNDILKKAGYDGITHIGEGLEMTAAEVRNFSDLTEATKYASKIDGRLSTEPGRLSFKAEDDIKNRIEQISPEFRKWLRENYADTPEWPLSEAIRDVAENTGYAKDNETPGAEKFRDIAKQFIEDLPTDTYRVEPKNRGSQVWIAFNPEAVKSATGNRGTYDPTATEIAYMNAGKKGKKTEITPIETKIHSQWGVRQWNPIDNGGSFLENMDIARWTAVKTPRGPVVYTNSSGLGFLNALYSLYKQQETGKATDNVTKNIVDSLAGNKGYTLGTAVPMTDLDALVKFASKLNEPEFQSQIDESLKQVIKSMQMAQDNGNTSVVFLSLDAPKGFDLMTTFRHEEIHRTQHDLENIAGRYLINFGWMENIPKYGKITEALKQRRYDVNNPVSMAMEITAHLGAGQYDLLGLSAKQAAKSFASILGHIVENHGVEALRRFNFDPQWKGIVNDTARRAERLRQQVESGTRTDSSNRSLFDRIQDWWNGVGKADGDRGLSDPISSEPGYQRLPWENAQTDLPGNKWTDSIKRFFDDSGVPYKSSWIDRIKTELLDHMTPVWKTWDYLTANKTLLPEENAFYLMRLWMGGRAKVEDALKNGVPAPRGRGYLTPGGVNWLFEPFKGTKAEFISDSKAAIQLMISQRTLEMATKKATAPNSNININEAITGIAGDNPTFTSGSGKKYKVNNPFRADITEAISKVNEIYNSSSPDRIARIEEAAKRYRQWSMALLDYAEAKGSITPQKAQELRDSGQAYVDLHRLFDDMPDAMLDSTPTKVGRLKKMFRKFSGSKETIGNVYTNLMIQTDQIIRESDRNEAMNAYVEPLREIYKTATLKQKQFYEQIGKVSSTYSKGSLKVMRNGVTEYWTFHPEVADTLGKFEQYQDYISKIVLPLKILKNSITHSPGFIARNFIRDAQQRTLTSRLNDTISDIINPLSGAKPWDSFKEVAQRLLFKPASLANRQAMWQYGAGQAGHYMSSRMDYQMRLRSAMQSMSTDRSVILTSVEKVGDFLWNKLPEISETAGRSAEFKAQYEKARADGLDDHNANIKAAFETRDLMDFAVSGRTVAWLNKGILFLNPAIQGLRREVASAKDAPLPFLMRWGLYSLIPTTFELLWNQGMSNDDPDEKAITEWRQFPNWRKDLFFNLYLGPDRWLTIPKPFTMGVASSLTNRMLDKFAFGNERAMEDAGGSMVKALIPVDDTALWGPYRAFLETQANYSSFFDDEIVSSFEEGRNPELLGQRGSALGRAGVKLAEYTVPGAFKKMGHALGLTAEKDLKWDPRQMDYFIRSSFGDFGLAANYTGELINLALTPDADEKTKSDIQWRLSKLAMGNMVRPAKPDQARDVKYVMRKAEELYGERAEWYTPVKEAIDLYREANTSEERQERALDAIFASQHIRKFLPEHERNMIEAQRQVETITSLDRTFKTLDKETQRMVKSELVAQMRELENALMTAKVEDDPMKLLEAEAEKSNFSLEMTYLEVLSEAQASKEEKSMEPKRSIPRR